jgi:D-arabinose 1-dehydrogenase-like Zn-dependent alcohol dehydrogenase
VCRTDLNIVEGDLAPHHPTIVPRHQIVGVVTAAGAGVALATDAKICATIRCIPATTSTAATPTPS